MSKTVLATGAPGTIGRDVAKRLSEKASQSDVLLAAHSDTIPEIVKGLGI